MEIINYDVSEEDLMKLSEDELGRLVIQAEKDMTELEIAFKVYLMCCMEIHRRIGTS